MVGNKKITSFASFLIALLLVIFFNVNSTKQSFAQGQAITVTVPYTAPLFMPPGSVSSTPVNCDFCMFSTTVYTIANGLSSQIYGYLADSSKEFENKVKDLLTSMMDDFKSDIDGMEKSISKGWGQAWFQAVHPALKNMMKQINVAMIEEVRQIQSFTDAKENSRVLRELDALEIEDERENRASLHGNVAATAAGGYGRAVAFSRAMRLAFSNEMIFAGINEKGDDKRLSGVAYNKYRAETYKNLFCDPESEGGNIQGSCQATDAKFYNADVQPNKFVYSRLTIPMDPDVDPDKNMFKALMAIRINLFGSPVGETISKGVLNSNPGREAFLAKRSYLAKYGAVMSVHNLLESWRMPGSDMGDWMKSVLGKDQETNPTEDWYTYIDNPSYKEIIHAMTIERFNNSSYAKGLISTNTDVKMEKLALTALQLMQLRDYYELLERTALVLAVQVSLMTDQFST